MKSALILERDAAASARTSQLLRCLGYVPAPVRTPQEALNVVSAIKFDVVVTYTAKIPNDRRSLTAELKRAAPASAVLLIADNDPFYDELPAPGTRGVSAVLRRPPSADAIRRVVQFGADGYGLQPLSVPPSGERRKARGCI